MHFVACIKQVPDTTEVRIDRERGTLVREGVPAILNPLDAHAVQAAAALADRLGDRATALSMGPPQAEEAVREAIARGCTDGVLLTDRAFAGSDTWATSYTLARAIRHMGDVDLVLCGKQAIDGDTAQVGPGIAAHLGWPQVTYVCGLPEVGKAEFVAERLTEYGTETVRCAMPAVLTVLKDLNVPRLPSLPSRMKARRCTIAGLGAQQIGGDLGEMGLDGSPTRVVKVFNPPQRGECTMLDGAAELARILRQRGGD